MRAVEEYLRPEIIQQVARLDLKARFIVEGFVAGLHDSPYYGFSSEFSDHRKYTPGDDPRSIDWRVFARTDRFYVKRFEAETNLDCNILLDASESMAFASGGSVSKMDYGICVAAALGYMMVHQQDNVGLVTFDSDLTNVVPPRSKRSHLAAILGVLASSLRHQPSRIGHCLHRAAGVLRRRGLVILFSDLVPGEGETADDVLQGLGHLRYREHDLVCFHVLDHAERTFPFRGPVRFVDVESHAAARTDAESVASAYRDEIRALVARYRSFCLDERIDFVDVDTTDSFDRVLLSFLRARQARF